MCRITDSTAPGILKSKAQHDRSKGVVLTTRECRENLLSNLNEEVIKAMNENVSDIIIAGDFNQDIQGERMQRFMRENGLLEAHELANNIEDESRDNTQKTGSKQIDAILITEGLSHLIKGSKITEFNEIINVDYRGFLVDLNVKEHFNIESSTCDDIQNNTLNPNK